MKKALLLFFVLFFVLYSADAQWHYKTCGVTDMNNCTPVEFDCLWNKASKIAKVGAITTGIGTSLIAVGGIIVGGEYAFTGVTLAMIGIVIDLVGIPIWITGGNRKSQLRKNPHFEALKSGSLNLYPLIRKNHNGNTYSVGLTASLRF
jgi:hypothetical protein